MNLATVTIHIIHAMKTDQTKDKKIVIIGAGPTGLGAAYRLQELGHTNVLLLDASERPGGLAYSDVDPEGFVWDYGGHVVFSHYSYFDKVLDLAVPDWISHQRESWVWMRDRWIPYPFQNNIQRLPEDELKECMKGLIEANKNYASDKKPQNFREWLEKGFGKGIMDVFLVPYNRKVWGYDPSDMNVEWMGERVATVDLNRVMDNIISGSDDLGWGPNSTFRFPLKGGTGAIWQGVYDLLDKDKVRLNSVVKTVDAENKVLKLQDGTEVVYDALISTMALDHMCTMIEGSSFKEFKQMVPKFKYSSTHVIGFGIQGVCPKSLRDKCWMYFPEDNCPFYRVTVFSKYSPLNVPQPGEQWSLMFEVCESDMRPVNMETIVDEVLKGALATKLIKPSSNIVSKYHRRFDHGYPTPFVGRDAMCKPIFEELEKHDIYSRGRFGAWKYEVSNQDHSFMQGVEAADHILFGSEEVTFHFPGVVNRRDWKDMGRSPKATPRHKVLYHNPDEVIQKAKWSNVKNKKYSEEKKADTSSSNDSDKEIEPATPWTEGKVKDAGANIERIILVDMDNTLVDWESRFEEMMAKHFPEVPLVSRKDRLNWNHVLDYPKEHREKVAAVCGVPGFFEGMKPNPGAIEALESMLDDGNQVFLVTSPDPNYYAQCSAEKYKWVENNLGIDWMSRLILTRDKTTVQGHILIDDKPEITGSVARPTWAHVVYTQTYNETIDTDRRLNDWMDWDNILGCKIPLSIRDKTNLYPNGINFSCVFPSFNQYEIVRKTLAGLAKQKIVSDFKFGTLSPKEKQTRCIEKNCSTLTLTFFSPPPQHTHTHTHRGYYRG